MARRRPKGGGNQQYRTTAEERAARIAEREKRAAQKAASKEATKRKKSILDDDESEEEESEHQHAQMLGGPGTQSVSNDGENEEEIEQTEESETSGNEEQTPMESTGNQRTGSRISSGNGQSSENATPRVENDNDCAPVDEVCTVPPVTDESSESLTPTEVQEEYILKEPKLKARLISELNEYVSKWVFPKVKFPMGRVSDEKVCRVAAHVKEVKLPESVTKEVFAQQFHKQVSARVQLLSENEHFLTLNTITSRSVRACDC